VAFFVAHQHVEICSDNKKGNTTTWQRMQLSLWQTFEAFVTCYDCIEYTFSMLTISEHESTVRKYLPYNKYRLFRMCNKHQQSMREKARKHVVAASEKENSWCLIFRSLFCPSLSFRLFLVRCCLFRKFIDFIIVAHGFRQIQTWSTNNCTACR
jgi:hypothetical protein